MSNLNNWKREPVNPCACGCGVLVAKRFKKGHGRRRPAIDRLLEKVAYEGDCWVYTGAVNPAGYGRIGVGLQVLQAHRVSYEALVGPIPDELHLDHVAERGCHSKACVNPAHLEPVTQAVNNQRSWDARKAGHAWT